MHRLEVLGLTIDLVERLGVFNSPRAKNQPRGDDFRRQ